MGNKIVLLFILLLLLAFANIVDCVDSLGKEEPEKAEPVLKNLSFDKETGVVSYELTQPAWVRIRVGRGDGPLYRTICDWERRPTGEHKEAWDGMEPSGAFKLTGRKDLAFTFNYFTAGDEYISNIKVSDMQPPAGEISGRHLPNLKINRLHKNHPREFCHEPEIRIDLPKDTPKTKDGIYIVKDKIPVLISLGSKDKSWFRSERYSTHIFVDDVFVQGELDGYAPYTWMFDPKGLNEGRHLIIVNLAGFNDHYGISSLPVYVSPVKNNSQHADKDFSKGVKKK